MKTDIVPTSPKLEQAVYSLRDAHRRHIEILEEQLQILREENVLLEIAEENLKEIKNEK